MTKKTVLLAGSTGYIGKNVELKLNERGYEVLPLLRESNNKTSKSGLKINFKCKKSISEVYKKCPKIDTIISCIGSRKGGILDSWDAEYNSNRILLDLGVKMGAKNFILLSAICVQKPLLEFQFAKLAFEKILLNSPLIFSIVRPTAFFRSLSGQIGRVKDGKKFILFDGGANTACKPISETDLANYLVDCINLQTRFNKILPIGGPGPAITPRDIGELIFKVAGKKPKFKSVSSNGFIIAEKALKPLGFFSSSVRDFQEFLRIASYYATHSMLCWNEKTSSYDAEITPEFGNVTFEDHLLKEIKNDNSNSLNSHKLFY